MRRCRIGLVMLGFLIAACTAEQGATPDRSSAGGIEVSQSTPPPSATQLRRPTPTLEVAGDLSVAQGQTARLVLRVTLPNGLHVQSNQPRDPDLIPTVLTVTAPPNVEVVSVDYPEPIDFEQPAAKLTLAVFDSQFEIVVTIRALPQAAPGTVNVPADLRYQACNDSICFVPARANTAWTLQIT